MQHRSVDRTGSRTLRRLAARSASATTEPTGAPAELRAVINSMPEAVFVCDSADRVRLVNPAADRLFSGRPVLDRRDLLSRFEPLPSTVSGDEPVALRPRDLPNRWFELRSFAIDRSESPDNVTTSAIGGGRGGRILVLRDVTTAREQRSERRALLSILSHELRTPITTIYAGSRVLARGNTATTDASREIAADISAEAARLYDVVENLLVLTRAEQGVLELSAEPVLLQRIIESAVRIAQTRIADVPTIRAGVTDPPAVLGDGVYLEQVVRNLVMAAAKFGGPGSPIIVRLEAAGDEVIVRVLDRGPDLSDDEILTSFALTDTKQGVRRAGLGIGMFVCRRLVEAMHGRVWASRRPDGGAEFGFALPRFDG
jgi:signal transduction histidine kinase